VRGLAFGKAIKAAKTPRNEREKQATPSLNGAVAKCGLY
jgi:hypothetical protein